VTEFIQGSLWAVVRWRTVLEFWSVKGIAMWPEEELEDLVCDVTCAVGH
jgi:hypothetical protein